MQYNDTTGDLNITDNVNIAGSVNVAGATMNVLGNTYLSSGTPLAKKLAAITPYFAFIESPADTYTLSIVVPAYAAPNFMWITADAIMGTGYDGDTTDYSSSITREIFINNNSVITRIGSLYVWQYIDVDGGEMNARSVDCSVSSTRVLTSAEYNPAVATTIYIGPRQTNRWAHRDDNHKLSVLCG